tara:strand:- start:1391 stop:1960 length:570 start_codon:yes stop_codon:yes gene_type:complete
MRIIAGKLKGAKIYLPENKNTRPLKDRVRESVFNSLAHSNKLSFKFEQSNVLDLYAGSGSFGLECLSRKAKSVYFVENEKNVIGILLKNIKKLKFKSGVNVFPKDVFYLIEKKLSSELKFDLIFCDPPFKDKNISKLIRLIFDKKILQSNGVIILHRSKKSKEKFPSIFEVIDERFFGISKITFGRFLF